MAAISMIPMIIVVLLLTRVQCQSYPLVSFMGHTLTNHSYVDITTVGDTINNVQCITDLSTCCSGRYGAHRGDWYFPDGSRLPFYGDINQSRGAQRVDLRRINNAFSPSGIYRCEIPTTNVHHSTDTSVRDTVYVGLYKSSGGDVRISGGVMYDQHRRVLTCITTGGPATTVTWTRDSTIITGGQTMLNDPVTANYTHTITVVGPGIYTCHIANAKPSNDSASLLINPVSSPIIATTTLNATTVHISWTSTSFYTHFHYKSVCNATGLVMTNYTATQYPRTSSLNLTLDDDDFDVNEHHFSLTYITEYGHTITNTSFAFDKQHFQIQFGPFDHCLSWDIEKVASIEEQLKSRLVRVIRKNCAECFNFTSSFLRKGAFLCHGNPMNTTYRSTLVNPYHTITAAHLVGIIQNWVSGRPSIVLNGLMVRVNEDCPTRISSMDEEECESGVRDDPALGQRIINTLNVCAVKKLGDQICNT